jgi:hypothetical protein
MLITQRKFHITLVRPYCISVLRLRLFDACSKEVEPRITERKGGDAEVRIETLSRHEHEERN